MSVSFGMVMPTQVTTEGGQCVIKIQLSMVLIAG